MHINLYIPPRLSPIRSIYPPVYFQIDEIKIGFYKLDCTYCDKSCKIRNNNYKDAHKIMNNDCIPKINFVTGSLTALDHPYTNAGSIELYLPNPPALEIKRISTEYSYD